MSDVRWSTVGIEPVIGTIECLDCGSLVRRGSGQRIHERFHSILASHAWALAVLKTAHIAAHTHNRYDVVERIDSRKFDNWIAEAFAEVAGNLDDDPGVIG